MKVKMYNMDIFTGSHMIVKDMLAYNMVAHGGPEWFTYVWVPFLWWGYWVPVGHIYPSEIEALWYHYYNPSTGEEFDVYPYDTIVFTDVSFGYFEPPSTDPTMAKAFVVHGASAFVGATISHTAYSDPFMRVFWNDLCQGNNNVEHAVDAFCDYWGHGWEIDEEWRIYGDRYATLP